MATAVYLLCAVTSTTCAALLLREYRRSGTHLLLWSGIAFVGLALTNALAFVDFVLLPLDDLSAVRPPVTFVAFGALLYGLVWEAD
jgi:Family of unknown function (DUF5985)